MAQDIAGTYRLIGTTAKFEGGGEEKYSDETGYIIYGRDGRMMVLLVRGKRPRPESVDKITDAQRVELFKTTTAYTGKYTYDGKKVTHHVDVSWNEVFNGMNLDRYVTRSGNRIMLTTAPSRRSSDGKMGVRTLTFEKVD